MAISRYEYSTSIRAGKGFSKPENLHLISQAVDQGFITCDTYVIKSKERLDQIAGAVYGNSSYWWVIAAASRIGWAMQLPQGTILSVPKDINDVFEVLA